MENNQKKKPDRYKEPTNLTLDPRTKAAAVQVGKATKRTLSLLVDDGLRLVIEAEKARAESAGKPLKIDLGSIASRKPRSAKRSA